MDEGTLELLRCLQSGPYDESSWKQLRGLLRTQRRVLRTQQDTSTLADLVPLLESWSQRCDDTRTAADVLREAADVAERELSHPALATDLRKRAVLVSHSADKPRATTNPHATLGRRLADAGDLDGAIDAYERALNVEAEPEIVLRLAELYAKRGEDGDAQQAADLFATVGDVLGNPAGIPHLEQALALMPDHESASALLAQYRAPAVTPPQRTAAPRIAPAPIAVPQPAAAAAAAPAPAAAAAKNPPPLRKIGGSIRPKLRPGTKAPVISIVSSKTARAVGPAMINTGEPAMAPELPPAAVSVAPEPMPSVRPVSHPAPATSLSPVVVDDQQTLERSRERLEHMRARKRKIAISTAAAAAAIAAGIVLFAPRTMQDAQDLARNMFGGSRPETASTTTTTTSAASAPVAAPTAPEPQPAPVPAEPVQPTAAAAEPTPQAAPAPATEQAAPTPAPTEPAPTPAPEAKPAPHVALTAEQFETRGGKWNDAQLAAAIEKLSPKLDQCYTQALEKRPRLRGKLNVAWSVKLNGKAAAVKKQGGTLKDADLVRCTLDAIGSTRFPKPRKAALSIKLPLEFRKTAG